MVICVTNRALCKENFLTRITSICKGKPKFILLREKDLSESNYYNLAKQCLSICKEYHIPLVLHTYIHTARALGVSEIHLPLPILRQHHNSLKDFTKVGTSVHSVEEAIFAEQLGAAYLIAGHIFPTDCKAGLAPRGIPFLKQILQSTSIPIYPIGGIHSSIVKTVIDAGVRDFCMMSELMTCQNPEILIKNCNQITP